MKKIFFLILLMCVLCHTVIASEITINSECGYSYISWNWSTEKPVSVYIDGHLMEENTSINSYIISDLPSEERHAIFILSNDTLDSGESIDYTAYKGLKFETYFLIGCWLFFILLGLMREGWLFSAIAAFISLAILANMLTYYTEFYIVFGAAMLFIISIAYTIFEVGKID